MISGLVDTSVLIHLFRKLSVAQRWLSTQTQPLGVSTTAWLEFMDGVPSKTGQHACLAILSQFTVVRLTDADQDWAMAQMTLYRLSAGVHMNDCLVASISYRLQLPLYTHNVKDHQKLLPSTLVIKPFDA